MRSKSILVSVAVLLSAVSANATTLYEVIDLGVVPDAVSSKAADINNQGQIVGSSAFSDGSRVAFLWERGSIVPLGGLTGRNQSHAYAINDSGQIVGHSYQTGHNTDQVATLFDPTGSGQNTSMGTLGGVKSTALDINNAGQIVGLSKISGHSYYFAASFDITGNQQNVTIGPAGSDAQSINDTGVAVGSALIDGGYHCMIFDMDGGSDYIDLGSLGGNDNAARSINSLGQIVGEAQAPSESIIAASFDISGSGTIVELGTLGGAESKAQAVNNLGQIVGFAYTESGDRHATLFDPSGGGANIDLNTVIDQDLGWTLTFGTSINDDGWIVGYGVNPEGYEHAFLLIPEPSTLILFGLGGLMLRRKRWLKANRGRL